MAYPSFLSACVTLLAWNVALQSIEAAQELHSLFVLCYKV